MSSKARKRPHAVAEENRADCPFTVVMAPPPQSTSRGDNVDGDKSNNNGGGAPRAKKRKSEVGTEERRKPHIQISPFEPAGKFRTHETMDMHYLVEPRKKWLDMTRYNSFVCESTFFFCLFLIGGRDMGGERERERLES